MNQQSQCVCMKVHNFLVCFAEGLKKYWNKQCLYKRVADLERQVWVLEHRLDNSDMSGECLKNKQE